MKSLTSSEKTEVDLVALRAWHWTASHDASRDTDMRRWHLTQVEAVAKRLEARRPHKFSLEVHTLLELSTECSMEDTYALIARNNPGDWQAVCRAAREAISRRQASRQRDATSD